MSPRIAIQLYYIILTPETNSARPLAAQVRPLLKTWARIGQSPSPLCPDCGVSPQTSVHLFNCPSSPTPLTLFELWTNPTYQFPDKKTRALEIRLTQIGERKKSELQLFRNYFLHSLYRKQTFTAGSRNFMGLFTRGVKINRLS